MNSLLKQVERQIRQLKRENDNSTALYDVVLIFDRSEEEMKRLKGYEAFIQALEELGGQRTEENIQEACRRSHFHRESVYFGERETEEFPLKIRATRSQFLNLVQKHKKNNKT